MGSVQYFVMARPPRLEFPGGVTTSWCGGNERAAVFRDDEDREKHLGRLGQIAQDFRTDP
jgi:hypothetical protein